MQRVHLKGGRRKIYRRTPSPSPSESGFDTRTVSSDSAEIQNRTPASLCPRGPSHPVRSWTPPSAPAPGYQEGGRTATKAVTCGAKQQAEKIKRDQSVSKDCPVGGRSSHNCGIKAVRATTVVPRKCAGLGTKCATCKSRICADMATKCGSCSAIV